MSKVTLSKTTLDVLKNFSTINSSIVFRQGSTVRTISNAENILAKFTGEEIFPTDFAIYDLSQFLSGISLFDNPSLEFTSGDFVNIRGGRQSAKYYFSDPEITLKSAPERNVKFPGSDIQFSLTGEDLINIQKASAVYSLPDLTFYSEEGSDYGLNVENEMFDMVTSELGVRVMGQINSYNSNFDIWQRTSKRTPWHFVGSRVPRFLAPKKLKQYSQAIGYISDLKISLGMD